MLAAHGAGTQETPVDEFLYACLRASHAGGRRLLDAHPGLLAQLDDGDRSALGRIAEAGNDGAVASIERGTSTEGITASPEDPKPPSAEVAALLLSYT